MATAQSIISSARYDLEDYQSGIMWDDTELLNYLNRMVEVMDSELASCDSELVEGEESDIDCVSSQKYVDISALNSGNFSNIKDVWIGTDLLTQIPLDEMRYKRMFRSGTAQPRYWCLRGTEILFEVACASAYTTLTIYYSKTSADLALTDSMPYADRFNEVFREMLVLYAQAKKDGDPSRVNGMMSMIFKRKAYEDVVRRNFIKKHYYIDF